VVESDYIFKGYKLKNINFLLLFSIIFFSGCHSYSSLEERELLFVPFGNKTGELGFKGLKSKNKFIFDERRFTHYLKFEESTISFLDLNNKKLLQFDLNGKLLIDYKIVNTNKNSHLAIDDNKNIYFLEESPKKMVCNSLNIESKKVISYNILKKFTQVKSQINRKKIGSSKVENIFSFDDDYIAIVGHSAYEVDLNDKMGKFKIAIADRVVIIDTDNNKIESIALKLDNKYSTNGNYYRIMKVSPIYNSKRGKTDFLLETDIYKIKDKTVLKEKKLFIFNRKTSKSSLITVPLKKWSAVLKASGSKIFILKDVKVTAENIIVYISVLNISNNSVRTFQIKNGINSKHIGELFVSRDGEIFSYKLTVKGLRIISWKQ